MGDDYKDRTPSEDANVPRTRQLEGLINGNTPNAKITMQAANRVDDGIKVTVSVDPSDVAVSSFETSYVASPDFEDAILHEIARLTQQHVESQIEDRKTNREDFEDNRTEIGQ